MHNVQREYAVRQRAGFGPGRIFAYIAGLIGLVGGLYLLLAEGTSDFLDTKTDATTGWTYNGLFAITVIVLGLILLGGGAAGESSARSSSMVVGILALAGGIFGVFAEGEDWNVFGMTRPTAVALLVAGVVCLIFGFLPTLTRGQYVRHEEAAAVTATPGVVVAPGVAAPQVPVTPVVAPPPAVGERVITTEDDVRY
jgi:hypothetical protein